MIHAPRTTNRSRAAALTVALVLVAAACSSDGSEVSTADAATTEVTATTTAATSNETDSNDTTLNDTASNDTASNESAPGETSMFMIEIWADNWSSVSVDGELIGEDSVPITTERSFNAETFTFEASYPFTVAIEAKDFMETSSGIEYIGEPNQQMGDGGLIAQITDTATGEVVSVTDSTWTSFVTQQAPLNTECVSDADPDSTCEFLEVDTPDGWTGADFDDSSWSAATVWSDADVDPKIGYDEITWDGAAELVWGSDLEVDNIILFRTTVTG